jgi:hypothetical protein
MRWVIVDDVLTMASAREEGIGSSSWRPAIQKSTNGNNPTTLVEMPKRGSWLSDELNEVSG